MPVKIKVRKASRATLRVLSILAFIEGCVTTVATNHTEPLIQKRVHYARQACTQLTNKWPTIGDPEDIIIQTRKNFAAIATNLNNIWWLKIKEDMNYPGLCYVAQQLLDDLMRLIRDKEKLEMLQEAYDGLTVLLDFVDPEGVMFLTQDRAQEIVNAVYSVVGES